MAAQPEQAVVLRPRKAARRGAGNPRGDEVRANDVVAGCSAEAWHAGSVPFAPGAGPGPGEHGRRQAPACPQPDTRGGSSALWPCGIRPPARQARPRRSASGATFPAAQAAGARRPRFRRGLSRAAASRSPAPAPPPGQGGTAHRSEGNRGPLCPAPRDLVSRKRSLRGACRGLHLRRVRIPDGHRALCPLPLSAGPVAAHIGGRGGNRPCRSTVSC